MIPAVSSSISITAGRSADGEATLVELNKQMQALQQKLSAAKQDTTPPRGAKATSISNEIVSVQVQMERIILEAQLAKLRANASANASGTANANSVPAINGGAGSGKDDSAGKVDSSAATPLSEPVRATTGKAAAKAATRYLPAATPASRLDERA